MSYQNNYDIVPVRLAVKAMRDNGYKNAAYAIAELVDNAIQAEATEIQILCCDVSKTRQRTRRNIHQIAVLDNGVGMDADVLRIALQFGNGLYLDPEKHTGIGRFGMGLPSSSISQCRRVDVWSWQNGPDSALHTYLSLDEIEAGEMAHIPEPLPEEIPALWQEMGEIASQSGTLVVWSDLDRILWKTSAAIVHNSEFLVGRIYRRFLHEGQVSILFKTFEKARGRSTLEINKARPNDPGYLMADTSCPKPFDREPMFMPWPGNESYEQRVSIDFNGQQHVVTIRYSIAKEEAREGYNPGAQPHGKHAKKNVGVSIMRAGRELELDTSWTIPYDPRERWWGVEIEFPPSLDDLFGVTNNKQSARNFTEIAQLFARAEDNIFEEMYEELEDNEDPRLPLYEIARDIAKNIQVMRRQIKAQAAGKRSRKRHEETDSAPVVATKATRQRMDEGVRGRSDEEEVNLPPEKRKERIQESLIRYNIPENEAEMLAAHTVDRGLKYIYREADLEGPAFFSVSARGGALTVLLNVNHPVYEYLVEVLEEEEIDEDEPEVLRARLQKASNGLKLLLMAWARYEDELSDRRREWAQDARVDWGRVARDFMRQE